MKLSLSGVLKYLPGKKGHSVYYHFTDQFGGRQRISLKLTVPNPERNRNKQWIFPADAIVIAQQIDSEVRERRWNIPTENVDPGMMLQEAFDQFMRMRTPNLAPATIRLHNLSFKKLFAHFGNVPVASINQDKMVTFREAIIELDGLENSAWWLRHLSAFFNYCADPDVGIINRTPLTKRIKIESRSKPIVIFSAEELKALYAFVKKSCNVHVYNQLKFLELTGWRVGDSCVLKQVHLEFERGVIRQFIRKGSRFRDYPMDDSLSEFLQSLPDLKEYVFNYRYDSYLGRAFRAAVKKKIPGKVGMVSIHTLRKQFTFNCYRNRVPVEDASRLLGHSNISTTLKYYSYWDTDSLRDSLHKSRPPVAKKWQKKKRARRPVLKML